jgi:hypothetical protein
LDVVFSSIREEEQRATAETVSRVSEISFTFTGKGRGGQEEEEEDELTGVGGNHEFKNSPVVALGNFSVGVLTVFGREGGEGDECGAGFDGGSGLEREQSARQGKLAKDEVRERTKVNEWMDMTDVPAAWWSETLTRTSQSYAANGTSLETVPIAFASSAPPGHLSRALRYGPGWRTWSSRSRRQGEEEPSEDGDDFESSGTCSTMSCCRPHFAPLPA